MGEFLRSRPALITQSFNHFSCPAGPVLINFSVHILTHTLYICKDMVPIYALHMLMWTQWHGWVSPCNIFLIRISVLSIEAWWIIYRRCRKEFTGGICACVQPKAVISVFKLPWDFGGGGCPCFHKLKSPIHSYRPHIHMQCRGEHTHWAINIVVDLREAPNAGQSDADKAGHEQRRMSKKQTAKTQSKKWKKKNLDCRAPGTQLCGMTQQRTRGDWANICKS